MFVMWSLEVIHYAETESANWTILHCLSGTSSIYLIFKVDCLIWLWPALLCSLLVGKHIYFRAKTKNHISFHNSSYQHHSLRSPYCSQQDFTATMEGVLYGTIRGRFIFILKLVTCPWQLDVLSWGSLITQLSPFLELFFDQLILML